MKSNSISAKNFFRTIALLAAVVLLLSPVLFVAAHAVKGASGEELAYYARVVLLSLLETTTLVLIITLLSAFLFGAVPAWLTHHYRFVGRRFLVSLQLLPLAFPATVLTGTYLEASSRFGGPLALGLVLGASTSPWVYLFLRVALSRLPFVLVEAAQTLGLGWRKRLIKIYLPLLVLPILFSAILVSAEMLSDFGAASRLGVETFSVGLHNQWQALQKVAVGTLMASVLLFGFIILAGPVTYVFLRRPVSHPASPSELLKSSSHEASKKKAFLVYLVCLVCVTPGFFAPLFLNIQWAIVKFPRARLDSLFLDAGGTILTALSVVLVSLACAVIVSTVFRVGERAALPERLVGLLCLNPLLPSLLFAFSILELGKRGGLLSWLWVPLESSWLIIVMAQALRFLPFILIPVADVLMRMPAHWAEAARTLGASAPRAYRQVILPQLRAPLAAGSLLIFVQSVNELTLSLLLQPFNYQSLSLRIFSYTGIYMSKEASIWVLLSLVICIYPIAALSRLLDPPIRSGRGEPRA